MDNHGFLKPKKFKIKYILLGTIALLGVVLGSWVYGSQGSMEAVAPAQGLDPTAQTSPFASEKWADFPLEDSSALTVGNLARVSPQGQASPTPTLKPSAPPLAPVNPPQIQAQQAPVALPPGSTPPYEVLWADPTNYGDRYSTDINGNPVYHQPIIVLHETVYSADSAINAFRTPHTNEADQASYHTLIRLNGTVVYMVPPEKRAFGAGNSVYMGANGAETVHTHRQYPPSVNNFAYHISLETPPDGSDDQETHSGYTEAQYRSLAWLVAQSSVPDERITTHRDVDRSESRIDPRSFDRARFLSLLHQLRGIP
jgi:hypothetical protein